MDIITIILIAGILSPFPLIIAIYLVWRSEVIRAKLGNLINKSKNYGLVDIAERGESVRTFVVPFSETQCTIGKRTFILPRQTKVKFGLPYAFFPYNDALTDVASVDFSQLINPKYKLQDPEVLNNTIIAVKTDAENVAHSRLARVEMFLWVIVVLALASILIGYLGYDRIGQVLGEIAKQATIIKA